MSENAKKLEGLTPGVRERVQAVLERAIENHLWRQQRCVNLIPSEMTPSPLVRLLQVTDPVGRYAEHNFLPQLNQEVFYYQGTRFIEWVEEQLINELRSYFGTDLIEPRLISGQMANMALFSAFVAFRNRGNKGGEIERIRGVLNHHLNLGGHLSAQAMGPLRDYVGQDPATGRFAIRHFPVCRDNPYRVDVEATAALLDAWTPELVIFGKSMFICREPIREIRQILAERNQRPLLMYDAAHVLGILGLLFQDPFAEGADVITGSTHKTFFGTQRGIIAARLPSDSLFAGLWEQIRRRAFPGFLSNHHLGTLLGLLLAAMEMNVFREAYQAQVIKNAKAFANALHDCGLQVEGDPAMDYTETHQVLLRVGAHRGMEAGQLLEENNIIVNYQALPGDENFAASSGLRMGVAEMTRFGMTEKDFEELAGLIGEVLLRGRRVADAVAAFRSRFLEMTYCFRPQDWPTLTEKLLATF
ncbi:MAG: serine hydroxymethyltransferase [Thermogutta sp.]